MSYITTRAALLNSGKYHLYSMYLFDHDIFNLSFLIKRTNVKNEYFDTAAENG